MYDFTRETLSYKRRWDDRLVSIQGATEGVSTASVQGGGGVSRAGTQNVSGTHKAADINLKCLVMYCR